MQTIPLCAKLYVWLASDVGRLAHGKVLGVSISVTRFLGVSRRAVARYVGRCPTFAEAWTPGWRKPSQNRPAANWAKNLITQSSYERFGAWLTAPSTSAANTLLVRDVISAALV
jgi:hypothetical protein